MVPMEPKLSPSIVALVLLILLSELLLTLIVTVTVPLEDIASETLTFIDTSSANAVRGAAANMLSTRMTVSIIDKNFFMYPPFFDKKEAGLRAKAADAKNTETSLTHSL